jgi:hypothetical protein
LPEQFAMLPHVARWISLSSLVGALAGSASAALRLYFALAARVGVVGCGITSVDRVSPIIC